MPATQAQLGDAVNALEGESEPAGEESEGSDVPRDSDVAASGLGEGGSENAPSDLAPGGAKPITIDVDSDVDDDVDDASQLGGGGGLDPTVDVSFVAGRFVRSLTRSRRWRALGRYGFGSGAQQRPAHGLDEFRRVRPELAGHGRELRGELVLAVR